MWLPLSRMMHMQSLILGEEQGEFIYLFILV